MVTVTMVTVTMVTVTIATVNMVIVTMVTVVTLKPRSNLGIIPSLDCSRGSSFHP